LARDIKKPPEGGFLKCQEVITSLQHLWQQLEQQQLEQQGLAQQQLEQLEQHQKRQQLARQQLALELELGLLFYRKRRGQRQRSKRPIRVTCSCQNP
jgi:hypothetical protein